MDNDKLRMQTPNLMEENFKKLAALFPSAVTEMLGDDGKARRTVDADVLRQLIGARIAEGREERYQFTWPEKAQSVLRACAPTRKTLRLDRAKSVGSDGTAGSIDTENIYIEGDNLEALKILQETYLGKVKMIYIDPPYNTGNDFIYRDDFSEDEDEYWEESGQLDEEGGRLVQNMESGGRFHTNWLNMIYPRLWLARDLLAQDGVIFISIDDNEAENLKKACSELFGERNFVANVIWKRKRGRDNSARWFSKSHEYLLIYARRIDDFYTNYLELNEETKAAYKNPDNDPRGRYRMLGCWARGTQGGVKYDFTTKSGQHFSERLWLFSKENLQKLDDEDKLIIRGDNVYRKMFLFENKGKIPETIWDTTSNAANAADEIKKMFGKIIFDTPKPIPYILEMLKIATGPNALVLDFFSGSGTTAHAVMRLNAEDGGNRRFIMIQLPEECAAGSEAQAAGYANICEIGEERIRRAGRKIREEMADKADGLDVGFRVFYVDSSNMKDVWYTPEETAQEGLAELVDNIKEDRTAEDLLFQAMLELGIELSADIAEGEIAGHRVFFVRGKEKDLAACFDANIKEETLTEIAKRQPAFAVFRDSGMADDSAYVNFEQIFKAYSPGTRRRVM